jgi:hypothetical protein
MLLNLLTVYHTAERGRLPPDIQDTDMLDPGPDSELPDGTHQATCPSFASHKLLFYVGVPSEKKPEVPVVAGHLAAPAPMECASPPLGTCRPPFTSHFPWPMLQFLQKPSPSQYPLPGCAILSCPFPTYHSLLASVVPPNTSLTAPIRAFSCEFPLNSHALCHLFSPP